MASVSTATAFFTSLFSITKAFHAYISNNVIFQQKLKEVGFPKN